jgi:hypothetical protein
MTTALATEALMRRDAFEPADRIAVFREFAAYFRGLVAFPEGEMLGVADEQYVRNVVDSIYHVRGARATAERRESVARPRTSSPTTSAK